MEIMDGQSGRWTRIFGRPTTFLEDMKRAKEVASEVKLFGIGDLRNHQFIEIVFKEIDGWECPLWASDSEWMYLRRPQGVWKTRLPSNHLDRIGMIGQRRFGSSKIYGGIQIGVDFCNSPAWHLLKQKIEPEDMDDYYGPAKNGYETGAPIENWIEDIGSRVIVDAGDAISEPPSTCRYLDGEVLLEGIDGRKVRLAIAGLDLDKEAREGRLWLRFGHAPTSWMAPFDCQVAFSG